MEDKEFYFFYFSSKVQARTAFAMYLVRVQQRLMTDCSSMSPDDVDGLNEQMVGIRITQWHAKMDQKYNCLSECLWSAL